MISYRVGTHCVAIEPKKVGVLLVVADVNGNVVIKRVKDEQEARDTAAQLIAEDK